MRTNNIMGDINGICCDDLLNPDGCQNGNCSFIHIRRMDVFKTNLGLLIMGINFIKNNEYINGKKVIIPLWYENMISEFNIYNFNPLEMFINDLDRLYLLIKYLNIDILDILNCSQFSYDEMQKIFDAYFDEFSYRIIPVLNLSNVKHDNIIIMFNTFYKKCMSEFLIDDNIKNNINNLILSLTTISDDDHYFEIRDKLQHLRGYELYIDNIIEFIDTNIEREYLGVIIIDFSKHKYIKNNIMTNKMLKKILENNNNNSCKRFILHLIENGVIISCQNDDIHNNENNELQLPIIDYQIIILSITILFTIIMILLPSFIK